MAQVYDDRRRAKKQSCRYKDALLAAENGTAAVMEIAAKTVAIYRPGSPKYVDWKCCVVFFFADNRAAEFGLQGLREGHSMEAVQNGQCGLCTHFGEHHKTDVLVSIMNTHQADLKLLEECGHPKYAPLHLKVTAISGCDGFEQVH